MPSRGNGRCLGGGGQDWDRKTASCVEVFPGTRRGSHPLGPLLPLLARAIEQPLRNCRVQNVDYVPGITLTTLLLHPLRSTERPLYKKGPVTHQVTQLESSLGLCDSSPPSPERSGMLS